MNTEMFFSPRRSRPVLMFDLFVCVTTRQIALHIRTPRRAAQSVAATPGSRAQVDNAPRVRRASTRRRQDLQHAQTARREPIRLPQVPEVAMGVDQTLIRRQAPACALAMRAIPGRAMLAQRVLRDPTRRTLVRRRAAFAKLANIPTKKARWRASNAAGTRLQILEPPGVCACLDTRGLVPRALPASRGSTRQLGVPPTALTAARVNILPPRRLPTRAPVSSVLLASIPASLAHTTKACVSIVRSARTMLRIRAVRRLRTCA